MRARGAFGATRKRRPPGGNEGGDDGDATRGDEIERRAGRGKIRSSEGGPETRDAAWE